MQIRNASPLDNQKWDEYVHAHPSASPYQLFGWMEAVENAYNFKKIGLVAEDSNRILGVLPIILHKIPLCKPCFVSLPYCDVGALLSNSNEAGQKLVEAAILLAQEKQISEVVLRGDIDQSLLGNCGYPVVTSSSKVRMLLDLPGDSEQLWSSFKSKLRSQVKKAEKNGLRFKFASERLGDFYHVLEQNMRDLGSPVHSFKWFKAIIELYGENAKIGLVYKDDAPVGAGIILLNRKSVSIPWASTLRLYNRLNPNMLLYWNFLKYCADNGFSQFDFGRSTINEGTYRFKSQWGAAPVDLNWHTIYMSKNQPSSNSKNSGKRALVAGVWKHLPLSIANSLGPVIRKYISL